MPIPLRAALAALTVALPVCLGARAEAQQCPDVRDVLVTNGAIHTMDARDTVVESVRIVGERVAATGRGRLGATRCTEIVDLGGRTAVPGLIDNHNHIVLLGLRPGHDTRLEAAASIADVQALLRERAGALPPGEWITAIGGFDINQFVPPPGAPRFPTLAELDAAVPNHPVYIQQSFAGPAATNTPGKRFFERAGIEVGGDGSIAGGFQTPNAATRALFELRKLQTLDDQKRGTQDALRYAASLGLTTHLDQGGFPAAGTAADGGHRGRRRRAHGPVPRLRRAASAASRRCSRQPHPLELPAHGDRRGHARARGAPR